MRRSLMLFVVSLTMLFAFTSVVESQGKKKPKAPIWSDQKDAFGDPLPVGAVARIGTTRYRLLESRLPQTGVLSPDGKMLAVVSTSEIEILDMPAWKRQRLITNRGLDKKNQPDFHGVAFSPDAKQLATYDMINKNIYVFEVATGKPSKKLSLVGIEAVGPPMFTFVPNTQTLISLIHTQAPNVPNGIYEVQTWDLDKGKMTRSFRIAVEPSSSQTQRIMSADGRWVAQAMSVESVPGRGADRPVIEIWDIAAGKSVRKIDTEVIIQNLAFSRDGKWLAACNGQSILRFYDAATGKEKHNIRMRRAPIAHLEFSPDNATLYVADLDGNINLWNPVSGERTASHAIPFLSAVRYLAFPPDGKVLALGHDFDAIHFWEVVSGKQFSPTGIPSAIITGTMFSPQGDLFVASEDGAYSWWNPRTGRKLRDLKLEQNFRDDIGLAIRDIDIFSPRPGFGSRGPIFNVTLAPNCEFLAATDGSLLAFHDAKTGKLLYDDDLRNAGDRAVTFLDGGNKVAAIQQKKLRIWSARTGRDLSTHVIPLRDQEVAFRLSASPNGKFFAVGTSLSEGGRTLIFDVDSQKVIRDLSAMTQEALVFSPDSQWLAVAGGQDHATLTRVSAARGETILRPGNDTAGVSQMAFSPDGRQLALGTDVHYRDNALGRIAIYEMASKKLRLELTGHPEAPISTLSYSRDGGLLASGSMDTTVLIWQAGLHAFASKPADKDASSDELADCYQQIAGTNAKSAFQKMIKLAQVPKQAVKLFEDKIPPAKKADSGEKTVPQWINDLGSGSFAVRSKASAMLQKVGSSVEPHLRAALPKASDVETKRRIEDLLERFAAQEWTQEDILHARAVEVLEAIATPESRALLTRWSEGDAGAVLTTEAAKALKQVR